MAFKLFLVKTTTNVRWFEVRNSSSLEIESSDLAYDSLTSCPKGSWWLEDLGSKYSMIDVSTLNSTLEWQ